MIGQPVSHLPAPDAGEALGFGPFRLLKTQKQLLEDGRPVRLGGRALDLLIALVDRAGTVVSRRELEACVWPRSVVEETSLRAHVSALRKALGDGLDGARYITNIPGRGYCFVAPVMRGAGTGAKAAAAPRQLPFGRGRLIGRDDALQSLRAMLAERRLVTIAGPGGMGKTSMALALCDDLEGGWRDGVRFVDLSPLGDATRLPATVALALGLPNSSQDPTAVTQALATHAMHSSMLLVLDNCEHVVEAAAQLAETLLAAGSGLTILATSREPLNAADEWVYRLAALELPPAAGQLTAAQAQAFAAVRLFVQRASATSESFALTDAQAPSLRDICRRLDGIPLAIELAAARVDTLGLEGLALRIDDHLALLTRGRRTAMPRHRTLRALMDWSHALLPPAEQVALRRLAVFRAAFTLDSAAALAGDAQDGAAAIAEIVLNLAAKSLLAIEAGDDGVRYRLLETTRAYAMEKLRQSGERRVVFDRHAARMATLMSGAEGDFERLSRSQWIASYAGLIDDARAALDWSFSAEGELANGVALTATAVFPVLQLGLLDGHHERIETALAHLRTLPEPSPLTELRLNSALYFNTGQSNSLPPPDAQFLQRTLELGEQLGEPRYRIAAFYTAWAAGFLSGDYPAAATAAHQLRQLAEVSDDRPGLLLGTRLLAQACHFMGEHEQAKALAQAVLDHEPVAMPADYSSPVPHPVSMGIVLARTLWLQGRPDQASALARDCVLRAENAQSAALIQAIGVAGCQIALWRGDEAQARMLALRLLALGRRHASDFWIAWAQSTLAVLELRESSPHADARPALAELETIHPKIIDGIGSAAAPFVNGVTLARAADGLAGWCAPEILRVGGERLRLAGAVDEAEATLQRSLALARQQGALSWELRTAGSLARLRMAQGRSAEARDLLAPVYARFEEGFDTTDLRAAGALLDTLDAELGTDVPLQA